MTFPHVAAPPRPSPATYSCKCAIYELSRRWLTELSVRKTEEEKNAEPQPQGGDEDRPPSSDGGQEEVNDFTDDDESMSGTSEAQPEPPEPTLPTEKYTGFFERQREVTSLESFFPSRFGGLAQLRFRRHKMTLRIQGEVWHPRAEQLRRPGVCHRC